MDKGLEVKIIVTITTPLTKYFANTENLMTQISQQIHIFAFSVKVS